MASRPTTPDQVCTVTEGGGTVAGADVTNVNVNCVTPPPVSGLDTSFGGDGKVSTPAGSAEAVAVQPDGAIVTAGNDSLRLDFQLTRREPDGDLDPSFGGGDGIVTTSFGGPLGRDEALDVALQPDGKILVAGSAQLTATSLDFALARYNPDGSLDQSFGGGDGLVTTDFEAGGTPPGADGARGIALQADGRIVLAGHAQRSHGPGLGFDNDFAVARYQPNGDVDGSFGAGGIVIGNFASSEAMDGVAVQPDGKIVVAGFSSAHSAER